MRAVVDNQSTSPSVSPGPSPNVSTNSQTNRSEANWVAAARRRRFESATAAPTAAPPPLTPLEFNVTASTSDSIAVLRSEAQWVHAARQRRYLQSAPTGTTAEDEDEEEEEEEEDEEEEDEDDSPSIKRHSNVAQEQEVLEIIQKPIDAAALPETEQFPITFPDLRRQTVVSTRARLVSEVLGPNTLLKKGYLTKQGATVKTWRKRLFVLRAGSIAYQKDESSKPLRVIPISECLRVELAKRAEPNCLELITMERPFYLIAESEIACEEWLFAFRYAMQEWTKHNQQQHEERSSSDSRVRKASLLETGDSRRRSSTLAVLTSDNRHTLLVLRSNNNIPRKTGYLTKLGKNVKSWKRRWFVLGDQALYYYKDKESTLEVDEPLGVLNLLDSLHIGLAQQIKDKPAIEFISTERVYFFLAETEDEAKEWVAAMIETRKLLSNVPIGGPPSSDSELSDEEDLNKTSPARFIELSTNDALLHKDGYLLKRGESYKSWKRRWIVARGSSLSYYKSEQDTTAIKIIDLSRCTAVSPSDTSDKPNCFELVSAQRTFIFSAESKQDMDDWVSFLRRVLAQLYRQA